MENNNNNTENINNIESDVKSEKPKRSFAKYYKSEAVKRAKAKYYQKKKQDEEYMQDMRNRALNWYYNNKGPSPNPRGGDLNEIEVYFPKITV